MNFVPSHRMAAIACVQRATRLGHPPLSAQKRKKRAASIATERPRPICVDVIHFPFGTGHRIRLVVQGLKKDQPVRPNTIRSVTHGRNRRRIGQHNPITAVQQNERIPRPLPFPSIDEHCNEGNPSVLAYLYPVNEK